MTVIMGIDPALRVTGWGVIECRGRQMHYRAADALHSEGANAAARLGSLSSAMRALLQEHRPEVMALEEAFVGRNSASALKLGEVRGLMMAHALQFDIAVTSYAARTIKKAVTGSGGASKQQVALMVRQCLSGDVPHDLYEDAWDALAVALCHAFSLEKRVVS